MSKMSKILTACVAALTVFVIYSPGPAALLPPEPPAQHIEYKPDFESWAGPYGFNAFCKRMPAECAPDQPWRPPLPASADRLRELETLNRSVNASIEGATDLEVYGIPEFWTIPQDRGDCEDYALLKRHVLHKLGWPTSSLLLTVVRDGDLSAHTVLIVTLGAAEYVLDNRSDELLAWAQTPYNFLFRQSEEDPRVWEPMWGSTTVAKVQ